MTFSQVSSPLPKSALLEFLQALNHELRTPLSVISNELYLLRSQSEGASRALEKVKEIDLLLTSIEAFVAPHVLNTPDTVVKSPMHLLLLKFTNEHPWDLHVSGNDFILIKRPVTDIKPKRLVMIMFQLVKVAADLYGYQFNECDDRITIQGQQRGC